MDKATSGFAKIPLLGRLAIKNSLVTEDEFDEAMKVCSEAGDPEEALKEYFLTNDLITPQNLKRLVTATKAIELRQKDIKFGTIAINKGLISRSVLDLALEEQSQSFKTKKNPRLIGDILVTAGIITVKHRNLILKTQNRLIKEIKQDYSHGDIEKTNLKEKISKDNKKGKAGFESESSSAIGTTEILKKGIKLEVSRDTLFALISKTDDFSDNINPEDIRELLIQKGITFGLVNNDLFMDFIQSRGFRRKGFIAAKGIKPVEGKSAKIEYFFDTDHLKAGGLSSGGRIDYKDRGIIPQVEKGTVLAEKTPLKASFSGRTIFDKELAANQALDIKLRYGRGARLSEDRLKILASVNGYPKLTWAGLVVVNQEYKVNGDVNYQTGHIKYDGNIIVKGCIKDGFEVDGNDVTARETRGGVIHARGNLNIAGGINEAKIYAKGNVYAKFIHNSKITCLGNIYIIKEIVDSNIETSGACIAKEGKIISCRITAKMGVFAKQLGTELSEPNIIRTGKDAFVGKELAAIKEKIKALLKAKNREEKKMEQLISKDRKQYINAREFAASMEKIQQQIDDLKLEKKHLSQWSEANPGDTTTQVTGIVFPGTIVHGIFSEKRIKEKMINVKIKELKHKPDDEKIRSKYEMVIT